MKKLIQNEKAFGNAEKMLIFSLIVIAAIFFREQLFQQIEVFREQLQFDLIRF